MSPQPLPPGSIPGIHHVTAITADPQANVDFYVGVLGQRFVKRTVNFDDPGSYHLYFGDELGRPGGIMTFFGWPGAARGRRGVGQLTQTAFSVPPESMDFWTARLRARGVEAELSLRFDDEVLSFADPDGLALELVASPGDDRAPWDGGPVPPEHGVHGFRAITVTVPSADATAALLTGPMGFEAVASNGSRSRFVSAPGAAAGTVDVVEAPREPEGIVSAGTVHHVAWRTSGDEEQLAWRAG